MFFDRVHGGCQGFAQLAVLFPIQDHILTRCLWQSHGATSTKIAFDQGAIRHLPRSPVSFDSREGFIVAIGGLAKE